MFEVIYDRIKHGTISVFPRVLHSRRQYYFPPSWDTEERREHAVLKSRRFYTNRPSEQ